VAVGWAVIRQGVTGSKMRYLIELARTDDDRVQGTVSREGVEEAVTFSGWAELLSLLEPESRETATSRWPAAGDTRTWAE